MGRDSMLALSHDSRAKRERRSGDDRADAGDGGARDARGAGEGRRPRYPDDDHGGGRGGAGGGVVPGGAEAGRRALCSRGDGTGFFTPETSRAKAMAAASFRMSTADLAERVAKGAPFWTRVGSVLWGQFLPSHGAVPIVVKGRVMGAIGCGGGTGEQDQECAAAGAAVLVSVR